MLTGFLFGAGASRELGMPLAPHLTDKLHATVTPDKLRQYNANWQRERNGYPTAIIDELAEILATDMSYEAVLGWLQTQHRRHNFGGRPQHYHGLLTWLSDVVYLIFYDLHLKSVRRTESIAPYFDGLLKLSATNRPLWIFSLNHDLMVECLAARYGTPLACGFADEVITLPRRDKAGQKIADLRANVLRSAQIEKRQANFFTHGQEGVNLLKLHGSLDVFAFNDRHDLMKLLPETASVAGVVESLRHANDELVYHHPNLGGKPFRVLGEIVYADDAGEMNFLRRTLLGGAYKFEEKHDQIVPLELLDIFQGNINYLTKLVCVGYGFGDLHINKVVQDWLRFTGDRRLEIVSPDAKLPGFLEHLAPQVTLTKLKASDYFDQAAGIIRGKSDAILKRYSQHAVEHAEDPEEGHRFAAFMRKSQDERISRFVDEVVKLPIRDGDIDLSGTGMTPAEFGRSLMGDQQDQIDALLEAYLKSQDVD